MDWAENQPVTTDQLTSLASPSPSLSRESQPDKLTRAETDVGRKASSVPAEGDAKIRRQYLLPDRPSGAGEEGWKADTFQNRVNDVRWMVTLLAQRAAAVQLLELEAAAQPKLGLG